MNSDTLAAAQIPRCPVQYEKDSSIFLYQATNITFDPMPAYGPVDLAGYISFFGTVGSIIEYQTTQAIIEVRSRKDREIVIWVAVPYARLKLSTVGWMKRKIFGWLGYLRPNDTKILVPCTFYPPLYLYLS